MTLEEQGLPTATIITDVFVNTGKAFTSLVSKPEFPFLLCPHPITGIGQEDLEARIRQLTPQVSRLLLEGRL